VIQALEELTDDAETAPSSQDQTGDATPTTAEDASGSATEVSADEDSTSQSGGDIGDFDTTDLDS